MSKPLNRVIAALGVALVLAAGVVLLVYSGGTDSPTTQPSATAAAVDKVDIKDFKFVPAAVSVPVGTTITWTNGDTAPHTATSGDSPSPDGLFDTGIFKQGQSRKIKLSKAGTFDYYCELHAFMQATVTVK